MSTVLYSDDIATLTVAGTAIRLHHDGRDHDFQPGAARAAGELFSSSGIDSVRQLGLAFLAGAIGRVA